MANATSILVYTPHLYQERRSGMLLNFLYRFNIAFLMKLYLKWPYIFIQYVLFVVSFVLQSYQTFIYETFKNSSLSQSLLKTE